jgi:hypothetical protein
MLSSDLLSSSEDDEELLVECSLDSDGMGVTRCDWGVLLSKIPPSSLRLNRAEMELQHMKTGINHGKTVKP